MSRHPELGVVLVSVRIVEPPDYPCEDQRVDPHVDPVDERKPATPKCKQQIRRNAYEGPRAMALPQPRHLHLQPPVLELRSRTGSGRHDLHRFHSDIDALKLPVEGIDD